MAHERKRKSRDQISQKREPYLGYYHIVTDTEETEYNYLTGLNRSIPENLKDHLVIKVRTAETKSLIDEVQKAISYSAQYREPWIVFDRDRIPDFDTIIARAVKNNINVGWSNPCIETWFSAYFGKMSSNEDSKLCCKDFERRYLKATKQAYQKSDKDIYKKLNQYGNEENAIRIAKQRFIALQKDGCCTPSQMCPATTLFFLVEEIKSKCRAK